VSNNLDTPLTALYVDLDDRVLPTLGWSRDHRPGRKPMLTDAELNRLVGRAERLGSALHDSHLRTVVVCLQGGRESARATRGSRCSIRRL